MVQDNLALWPFQFSILHPHNQNIKRKNYGRTSNSYQSIVSTNVCPEFHRFLYCLTTSTTTQTAISGFECITSIDVLTKYTKLHAQQSNISRNLCQQNTHLHSKHVSDTLAYEHQLAILTQLLFTFYACCMYHITLSLEFRKAHLLVSMQIQ